MFRRTYFIIKVKGIQCTHDYYTRQVYVPTTVIRGNYILHRHRFFEIFISNRNGLKMSQGHAMATTVLSQKHYFTLRHNDDNVSKIIIKI